MGKMRLYLTLLFLITAYSLSAQQMLIKNADAKFKEQLYNKAIELYNKAYNEKPTSYYVIKRLALSNQKINNTVEAERWMKVLFENGRTISSDLLMYSEILMENGDYKQARHYLEEYEKLKPGDKKLAANFEKLDFIESIIKDSVSYTIISTSVNTPGAELGTCYYKNGIVFSSTSLTGSKSDEKLSEDELPFLDLYFSLETSPGVLAKPIPFAPKLNTRFNDGPVSYDPVDNLFYITQYAPKEAKVESEEAVFHLQIVVAKELGGEWVFKEGFFFNSPTYSVAHPSISPDGRIIYFVSDMPGGYGGSDIYFCYKEGNKWSEPFNLGPVVNSSGNEFFPFIDNLGNLYFSSNGHLGLGGQDIFIATSDAGVFNTIKNVGYPLNSPKDDVAFVLDSISDRGYFSSNRVESLGYFDIYSVKLSSVNITIKGIVKDVDNKSKLAGVDVALIDEYGNPIVETQTKENGIFSFLINKIPKIVISAKKPGYESMNKTIEIDFLKAGEELNLEMFLRVE